jgi:hypothetical protein
MPPSRPLQHHIPLLSCRELPRVRVQVSHKHNKATLGGPRYCAILLEATSSFLLFVRNLKDQLVLGSSLASNTAKHTWMRPIVMSIHSFINIPLHLIVLFASSKSFQKKTWCSFSYSAVARFLTANALVASSAYLSSCSRSFASSRLLASRTSRSLVSLSSRARSTACKFLSCDLLYMQLLLIHSR